MAGSNLRQGCFVATAPRSDTLAFLKEEAIRHHVPLYCRRVANRYLNKAREALTAFPESAYKDSLLGLTDFLLNG